MMGGYNLFYAHFTRLRDEGIALTKSSDDSLEELDLDKDEYVAEDIGMIFDTQFCSLCIQRNFHSLSITGITEYFQEMYKKMNDKDESGIHELDIYFKPVADREKLQKLKDIDNYRSIELSYAQGNEDIPSYAYQGLSYFKKVLEDLDGEKISVVISVGHSQKKSLKRELTKKISELVQDHKSSFKRAKLRGKIGNQRVEPYDLLNEKLTRTINFVNREKGKKKHLRKDVVLDKLIENYFGVEGMSFRSILSDNV
ncbi:hypothetical protein MOO45_06810 [Bombilactobacillus folatiphilus]|uniref:Uncharacterized protein n=1 Tax=Bombilactobacillus folatiphilus TaxID=2923362 RepID=A0ABY4P8A8_9LACO|nr:DUF6731 family protein [Bombilactobacillus folatiphilus]UQS81897.1 hypothetical protein MOO45_06810 [Bombilactobacillus folatiphilus]